MARAAISLSSLFVGFSGALQPLFAPFFPCGEGKCRCSPWCLPPCAECQACRRASRWLPSSLSVPGSWENQALVSNPPTHTHRALSRGILGEKQPGPCWGHQTAPKGGWEPGLGVSSGGGVWQRRVPRGEGGRGAEQLLGAGRRLWSRGFAEASGFIILGKLLAPVKAQCPAPAASFSLPAPPAQPSSDSWLCALGAGSVAAPAQAAKHSLNVQTIPSPASSAGLARLGAAPAGCRHQEGTQLVSGHGRRDVPRVRGWGTRARGAVWGCWGCSGLQGVAGQGPAVVTG